MRHSSPCRYSRTRSVHTLTPTLPPTDTHHRRALTLIETLVITLSILGIGITAFIASPRILKANTVNDTNQADNAASSHWPEHVRNAVDALGTLISKSTHTLPLHSSATQANGQTEFVALWLNDNEDPGHPNQSEIVILRHSQLLQSITAYAIDPEALNANKTTSEARITSQITQPQFIDTFLRQSSVKAHVIGIKITHWQVVETSSSDHTAQSLPPDSPGRIQLTCLSQSDDNSLIAKVPTPLRPNYRPQ